jgi:hypothetical protein
MWTILLFKISGAKFWPEIYSLILPYIRWDTSKTREPTWIVMGTAYTDRAEAKTISTGGRVRYTRYQIHLGILNKT